MPAHDDYCDTTLNPCSAAEGAGFSVQIAGMWLVGHTQVIVLD
jgi:hypothetical protein